MKRTVVFITAMFLVSLSLYAEAPRSRRHGVSAENAVEQFNAETVARPRRGKSIAQVVQIETAPSYASDAVKRFDPPDVTQWKPSAAKSIQVAALPAPVIYSIPDTIPVQKIESLPVEQNPVVEFGLPANAPIPVDMGSTDFVLAKEKTLTPTLEDGVNDEAVFGPGAEEVTIKDVKGRRIFHARRRGIETLKWDCHGPAGKIVEDGIYFVLALNQDGIEFRQSFTVIR